MSKDGHNFTHPNRKPASANFAVHLLFLCENAIDSRRVYCTKREGLPVNNRVKQLKEEEKRQQSCAAKQVFFL